MKLGGPNFPLSLEFPVCAEDRGRGGSKVKQGMMGLYIKIPKNSGGGGENGTSFLCW